MKRRVNLPTMCNFADGRLHNRFAGGAFNSPLHLAQMFRDQFEVR